MEDIKKNVKKLNNFVEEMGYQNFLEAFLIREMGDDDNIKNSVVVAAKAVTQEFNDESKGYMSYVKDSFQALYTKTKAENEKCNNIYDICTIIKKAVATYGADAVDQALIIYGMGDENNLCGRTIAKAEKTFCRVGNLLDRDLQKIYKEGL